MKVLSYIISLIFLWSTGAMAFAPGFLQVAGGGGAVTFVGDTFTGTDGATLTSHTSDSGHSWSIAGGSGTAYINGNRVWSASGGGVIYYFSYNPSSANYSVSCVIRNMGSGGDAAVGVTIRSTSTWSPSHTVMYSQGTGGIRLFTSGGNVASYTTGFSASEEHTLKITEVGNDITVYWDGNSVINYTATSGEIISNANYAGIYLQGSSSTSTTGLHIDSFLVE